MALDWHELKRQIDIADRLILVWSERLKSAQQSQDGRLMETAQRRKRHYDTKLGELKKALSVIDELIQSTPLPELCTFCGRHTDEAGPLIAACTKQASICQDCCVVANENTARDDFVGASAVHRCSFCGKEQDFEHRKHLLVGSPKAFICIECIGRFVDVFTKSR